MKTQEQATSNKITIITEILNHIVNSSKTMDENTKTLNNHLSKLEKLVKDNSKKDNQDFIVSQIINIFNMFVINFRIIFVKLSEIETSLALSKVSVLHKAILNSSELLKLLNEISKFDNLMYPVNEQTLINLEETFTVKSYVKSNYVRFIINVPLVDNATYNYYKLYSLPISTDSSKDTLAIIPEFPYLIVEGLRYRPIAHKCKEITAKEYLCSEDDLTTETEESCVEQLMQYKQDLSRCSPQRVNPENLKIEKISHNSWILFSKFQKTLFQRCGDDVIQEELCGTYILTIQKSCDVFIDNFLIYGHHSHSFETTFYKRLPMINLPKLHENTEIETEPVDLKGINLDDIQHLNFMLKKSAENDNRRVIQVKSVGIATIVLYILITVIIMCLIWSQFHQRIQECFGKHPRPVNDNELNAGTNERPIFVG